MSKIIGEEEHYITEKTTSEKNTTLSKKIKKSRLILPSEIQELKDLHGILKQYNMPYVKAKWEYKKFNKINESFIDNECFLVENVRQF